MSLGEWLRCSKCGGQGKRIVERLTPVRHMPSSGHPTMRLLWFVGNVGKLAFNQVCKCKNCGHIWVKVNW